MSLAPADQRVARTLSSLRQVQAQVLLIFPSMSECLLPRYYDGFKNTIEHHWCVSYHLYLLNYSVSFNPAWNSALSLCSRIYFPWNYLPTPGCRLPSLCLFTYYFRDPLFNSTDFPPATRSILRPSCHKHTTFNLTEDTGNKVMSNLLRF